jgi:lysophospholipase L1-like esterase
LKKSRDARISASLVISSSLVILAIIFGAILLAERHLRGTGRFNNYFESNGLPFQPGQQGEGLREPFLYERLPNIVWVTQEKEFTQKITTNSEGLTGTLPPLAKSPDTFRIIAIGDSFTEGIGDPTNLGYVGRLAGLLGAVRGPRSFEVMNAGVIGSDPVYGLELLRRKLFKYTPDLVLLTINSTDIGDLMKRGGFDRFTPAGQVDFKLPWWSWFFDRSHLVRAFMLGWLHYHYDWYLRSPRDAADRSSMVTTDLIRAGVEANGFARQNGFKLLVLIHPLWTEVRDHRLPGILREVEAGLRREGVDFADLLPEFLTEIPSPIPQDYYWPTDGHYTAKGYQVFANAVGLALRERGYTRALPSAGQGSRPRETYRR